MREILFKAKRDGSGKWVEGCYAECKGKTFIGIGISIGIDAFKGFCTPVIRWFEVDPETLCQFTGLCDKNGKKIWENDILRFTQQDETKIGVIKYNAPIFTYFGLMRWSLYKDEVIGNIFDNPELLQEESDE